MGAFRSQLIFQFVGESLVITLISVVIAIGIMELAKPYFFYLIEQELNLSLLDNPMIWVFLLTGSMLISVISAFYPAIALSSFKPSCILRGTGSITGRNSGMRKGLVILQFTISSALILGTFVVFKQLTYMQQKSWVLIRSR